MSFSASGITQSGISSLPAPGTQGRILYDTGSVWTPLAVGTSGHFLKTQGAAANPTWAEVSVSQNNRAGEVLIIPISPDTVTQGTWSQFAIGTQMFSVQFHNQTGAANGDSCRWTVSLPTGTYKLVLVYASATSHGIIDIKFNAQTLKAGLDTYNGSTVRDNISETTGISVTGADNGNLSITLNGKNASSSAYECGIQAIYLRRTA